MAVAVVVGACCRGTVHSMQGQGTLSMSRSVRDPRTQACEDSNAVDQHQRMHSALHSCVRALYVLVFDSDCRAP